MTYSSNDAEGESASQADEAYDPGLLLDRLSRQLHLTDYVQLARILRIDKKLLVRIRDGKLPISGSMLMCMQEASGLTVDELRVMLNDRRKTSRMAGKLKRHAATS